ncbi:glycoside hydrolase family protein [Micromonospora carbonacea]|uniref:Lysozyme n=1 Tax=Micromonospora carbonacea TaxID=47853 RepID=A0A7H8XGC0_9ACTN|nr:glycoside hydrolase family protein [Micromonospora carbonacea]MBB5829100.1 GH24 family phage-related lysozyme (muramidase) [Micromonospora carbonacea]QLD23409.1 glycoside hydrolase family protein [Micromonospora carbonacea]
MYEARQGRRRSCVTPLLGLTTAFVIALTVGASPALADLEKPPKPPQNGPCLDGMKPRQMELAELKLFIANHESSHGLAGDPHVYLDSEGIPTVGIGFNLNRGDAAAQLAGVGANYNAVRAGQTDLTQLQITRLFEQDVARAIVDARALVPGLDSISTARQAVVIDMIFNLGRTGLSRFTSMLTALNQGDYATAAKEMQNSAWYDQTGNRARQDVTLMDRGIVCDPLAPQFIPPMPPPVSPDIPGIPATRPGYTPYPGGVETYQPGWGGSPGGGSALCSISKIEVYYQESWIGVIFIDC